MEKKVTKKRKLLIWYMIISILVFVISFIPTYTYTYWNNIKEAEITASGSAVTGEWDKPDTPPDDDEEIIQDDGGTAD